MQTSATQPDENQADITPEEAMQDEQEQETPPEPAGPVIPVLREESLLNMGIQPAKLSAAQIRMWNAIVEEHPRLEEYESKAQFGRAITRHFERIHIFRQAVQGAKFNQINPKTEAGYRQIVRTLERDHGSLEEALEWMTTASLRPTTFLKYKSAIGFIARQAQDLDLLQALSETKQDKSTARKWTESAHLRTKNITEDELQKIGEWLRTTGVERVNRANGLENQERQRESGVVWITRTITYLMATRACGFWPSTVLRPSSTAAGSLPKAGTRGARRASQQPAWGRSRHSDCGPAPTPLGVLLPIGYPRDAAPFSRNRISRRLTCRTLRPSCCAASCCRTVRLSTCCIISSRPTAFCICA